MEKVKRAFKYVVLLGILLWGLATASLLSLLYPVINVGVSKLFHDPALYWHLIVKIAPKFFKYAPVGGFLWGIIMWILVEAYGEKDSKVGPNS